MSDDKEPSSTSSRTPRELEWDDDERSFDPSSWWRMWLTSQIPYPAPSAAVRFRLESATKRTTRLRSSTWWSVLRPHRRKMREEVAESGFVGIDDLLQLNTANIGSVGASSVSGASTGASDENT